MTRKGFFGLSRVQTCDSVLILGKPCRRLLFLGIHSTCQTVSDCIQCVACACVKLDYKVDFDGQLAVQSASLHNLQHAVAWKVSFSAAAQARILSDVRRERS